MPPLVSTTYSGCRRPRSAAPGRSAVRCAPSPTRRGHARRRVEQTDPSIERSMNRDGSPVVAIGRGRQAHAAHPDTGQTSVLTRHVGRHRRIIDARILIRPRDGPASGCGRAWRWCSWDEARGTAAALGHRLRAKSEQDLSWFEAVPEISLRMLDAAGLSTDSCVLDVGGGESRLIDHLAARGVRCLAVLDISATALQRCRSRLGAAASVPNGSRPTSPATGR